MWLLLKDLDCNNLSTCNLTWTLLGPWTSRLKTFLPSQAEDYCSGEIPDIISENLGFKDPRSMNEGDCSMTKLIVSTFHRIHQVGASHFFYQPQSMNL